MRTTLRVPALLAAIAAIPAVAHAQIAIQNVTVIPMDAERLLANHTVFVEGDRIVRVGPADSVTTPLGATVIDGTGLYLMPGLSDMHIHLNGIRPDLSLYLANGITTVRVMFGSPTDLRFRKQIEEGLLLGPTIYAAGPIIDGDPPAWPGSTVVIDSATADSVVRSHAAAGYDFVKVYERLTPDAYRAVLAASHRYGIRAVGHVPRVLGLADAIQARQTSIEHLTGFRRSVRPDNPPLPVARNHLPDSVNQARIQEIGARLVTGEFAPEAFVDSIRLREFAEAMRDAGVWNVPTLTVIRATWLTHDDYAEFRTRPELEYVHPMVRPMWDLWAERRFAFSREVIEKNTAEARAWMAEEDIFVRALKDAGAGLLLGTDTPNPNVIPGFSIHEELAHLVHAGLTPYEALAAGTVSAAKFFGAMDEFGRVAEGLRADLVLLEGNPLEDVKYVSQIRGVMVRGRWLPREELDQMLAAVLETYTPNRD